MSIFYTDLNCKLGPSKVNVQPKPAKRSNQVPPVKKLHEISEEGTRQKERKQPSPQYKASKKTPFNFMPSLLGIIISGLLYVMVQYHLRITRPLESGSILLPGEWKSQCGLFHLIPQKWLAKLPMDKLCPACHTSSTSSLELGNDGRLRYFAVGSDGEKKEMWSVAGGAINGELCPEGNDEQCSENGALFVKDGHNWYVFMGGSRSSLNKDVIRDFTAGSSS